MDCMGYTMCLEKAVIEAAIVAKEGHFRVGKETRYFLDDQPCGGKIPLPVDGKLHRLRIEL